MNNRVLSQKVLKCLDWVVCFSFIPVDHLYPILLGLALDAFPPDAEPACGPFPLQQTCHLQPSLCAFNLPPHCESFPSILLHPFPFIYAGLAGACWWGDTTLTGLGSSAQEVRRQPLGLPNGTGLEFPYGGQNGVRADSPCHPFPGRRHTGV